MPHACLFWSLLPRKDKAPTFSTKTNRFSHLPLSHKVLERGAPARLRLAGQPQLWAQCLVTVVTQPSLWPDGAGGRGWDSWLWWPDGPSFLSQVVKACNEGVRKMSRTEQMICIQKKMEFKIKVNWSDWCQPVPMHGPLAPPCPRGTDHHAWLAFLRFLVTGHT